VAVVFAGNREKAEAVVGEIQEMGRRSVAIQADVSQAEQVDAMVKQVVEAFGRIDILVNNAGITRDNLLLRLKEEDWDAVLSTNLKGVFLCTKAVTRQMMKQRFGRIINISSVVGLIGNPGQANYVAAKAGVIGLTKTAARELASRGISVNAVAPGFIETDMTAVLGEETREQMLGQIPLGRFGSAEDVAGAVAFLASDDAAYITGQTLNVDGGMVTY
jgi:3-oxoacyl-[acyl-carrier protein] reductase